MTNTDPSSPSSQSFQNAASELLKDLQSKELLAEAKDFIQKNPWLAVGGAVVVGYLLAKMTRSQDKNR